MSGTTGLLDAREVVPPPILEPEHYEVIDGQIVQTPRMGAEETWIANVLAQALAPFATTNHLGRVAIEILFSLGEGRNKRRPDLAFVSYARWAKDRRVNKGEAWEVVPDLAVEVISPSNTMSEIARKTREYFAAGVVNVWVVIPETREVQVWESTSLCRAVSLGEDLEGGTILPGFRMPVAALFEEDQDA